MPDLEKAIRVLEGSYKNSVLRHNDELITVNELLTLLKAQEPIEARLHLCESCTKEYPECDATIDGIEFGCGVGNDNIIGCTAYVNRWKAQEPVEPQEKRDGDYRNLYCGACGRGIVGYVERLTGKQKMLSDYCRCCGRAVKWE